MSSLHTLHKLEIAASALGITASAVVWANIAAHEIVNKLQDSDHGLKYEVMEDTGCYGGPEAQRRTIGIYIRDELVGTQRELYRCRYSRWGGPIYEPVSSKIRFEQKLFVQKAGQQYKKSSKQKIVKGLQ